MKTILECINESSSLINKNYDFVHNLLSNVLKLKLAKVNEKIRYISTNSLKYQTKYGKTDVYVDNFGLSDIGFAKKRFNASNRMSSCIDTICDNTRPGVILLLDLNDMYDVNDHSQLNIKTDEVLLYEYDDVFYSLKTTKDSKFDEKLYLFSGVNTISLVLNFTEEDYNTLDFTNLYKDRADQIIKCCEEISQFV